MDEENHAGIIFAFMHVYAFSAQFLKFLLQIDIVIHLIQ